MCEVRLSQSKPSFQEMGCLLWHIHAKGLPEIVILWGIPRIMTCNGNRMPCENLSSGRAPKGCSAAVLNGCFFADEESLDWLWNLMKFRVLNTIM